MKQKVDPVPGEGSGKERQGPTPILISRRARAGLVAVVIFALALLMWYAPTVPVTLLGGFAAALALSFPVRWLSRVMRRGLAIMATFLILVGIVAFGIFFLVPILITQLASLIEAAPELARDVGSTVDELLAPFAERGLLPGTREEFLDRFGQDLLNLGENLGQQLLGGLAGLVSATLGIALGLFGVVFTAVYLLVNVRGIKTTYLRAAPKRYRHDARDLWNAFALSLSRYLSGLVFVMVVQGVISAIALAILGVPYAILLGAWVSLTAIIPYLGAWLGAIPAVVVALTVPTPVALTGLSPVTTAILTGLVFLAIQQLEGNVLTPRIQGEAVNLPSLLIFLGVLAGGQIAGLLGVLFAVPALAVLRVLFDFFRERLQTED